MPENQVYTTPSNRQQHRRSQTEWVEGLLDDQGAARYLGTSVRHIRHLRETRRLPFVRVGRKPRHRIADLDAFAAANVVEAVR